MNNQTTTIHRDGDAIVIDIPMNLRRRSGRKEIFLPRDTTALHGDNAPTVLRGRTKPHMLDNNETLGRVGNIAAHSKPSPLAQAIARGFRWQEMIETGRAKSNSDLARKLKLDQSYIARTIRLTSLAPDLIETVILGQEPETLNVNALRRNLPLDWNEQRALTTIKHSNEPRAHAMTDR